MLLKLLWGGLEEESDHPMAKCLREALTTGVMNETVSEIFYYMKLDDDNEEVLRECREMMKVFYESRRPKLDAAAIYKEALALMEEEDDGMYLERHDRLGFQS